MGKIKNLSGKIFGKLKVIEPIGKKGGLYLWLCECSCGNIRNVTSSKLLSGRVVACKKCSTTKNISGQKFGRLIAIKIIGKDRWNANIWLCECECGKENTATTGELTQGRIKSCGCLQRDSVGIMKDISGKRSSKLVAIEPTQKKNGSWYWLCKCDCGNFIEVIGASITNGNTNSCGCLSESLISTKLKEYCYKKYSSKSEYNILKNPETGRYLPFDIYIECFKIFIEINGEQHYENSDFWHGKDGLKYNKQKERDKLKKQYAKKNGIYIEIDLRKVKTVEKAIAEVENIIKKYFNKKKKFPLVFRGIPI